MLFLLLPVTFAAATVNRPFTLQIISNLVGHSASTAVTFN